MTHDPLCPTVNADVPFGLFHDDVPDDCLFCALIARVREDERRSASVAALTQDNAAVAYAAALRDAVEAVKLSCSADIELVERIEVIAAIEALGGER